MTDEVVETTCCVIGGGPAGIMLGYLLARDGVRVTVLEKHKDFLRDFRGDTVHPSTLDVLNELGLLEDFLRLPHQQVSSVGGVIGGLPFRAADFSHLPVRCRFVALMPQWDFLNFLSDKAKELRTFERHSVCRVNSYRRELQLNLGPRKQFGSCRRQRRTRTPRICLSEVQVNRFEFSPADPMNSPGNFSLVPLVYMFAVSMTLPPASR